MTPTDSEVRRAKDDPAIEIARVQIETEDMLWFFTAQDRDTGRFAGQPARFSQERRSSS